MKRITTPNRAVDLFGAGKDGYRSAVPGVSTATEFAALWFNHAQEALVRTREAAGIAVPADNDFDWFVASLKKIIAEGGPAGKVSYFAMSTAPTGWLKANGALISRTTYAALFAAIGTTFGVGDGATTFAVPDLRGEFLRGWDDGRGVDPGRSNCSGQLDLFKSHAHGMDARTDIAPSGAGVAIPYTAGAGGIPTTSTGGAETRPRNIALLACIKY